MKKIMFIISGIFFLIILASGLTVLSEMNSLSEITKGNIINNYPEQKKALIIIDIQRNITEKTGTMILNLKQTDEIIDNINKIIDSSDKHDLTVIYITNEFKKKSLANFLTKKAIEKGSEGAKIDPRIKIINNNFFIKYKMDTFTSSEFENFLIKNQINNLIITGLDAENCVDKTVKAAINRQYKLKIISNGIATKTEERRNKKINEFKNLGAEIMTTDELLR